MHFSNFLNSANLIGSLCILYMLLITCKSTFQNYKIFLLHNSHPAYTRKVLINIRNLTHTFENINENWINQIMLIKK